jgi:uroporphyrin-3 C-methyltransferase
MSKQKSSGNDDKIEQEASAADREPTDDAAAEETEFSTEQKPEAEADSGAEAEGEAKDEAEAEAETVSESEAGPKIETEADNEGETETAAKSAAAMESQDAAPSETAVEPAEPAPPEAKQAAAAAKPRRSWWGFLNFLLIVALAATAAYYWREQQQIEADYRADLAELGQRLAQQRTDSDALRSSLQSSLQSRLSPIEGDLGSLQSRVDELGLGQQSLRESSEKLYELFGRDRNDWQLAEVEYLMRVAQHKLILQDDFEGAAVTLQAASDRIGLTGDPGLLPVRVMISEEIADLKTRKRPDLVGMTLILSQLGRQIRSLQPGFAIRIDENALPEADLDKLPPEDWLGRFKAFLDSLISVRKESAQPSEIEANVVDVAEVLEDNLKLARWAVLERNASQYEMLMDRSLRLFREFYDLDNAANHDFMTQLQDLQKMELKPEKPDITGSLRELQRILSQRENEPQPAAPPQEASDG